MDVTALFKMSYGIYLLTAHEGEHRGGCLVNTVFQITAEPPSLAVSVSKNNETHRMIQASGTMCINVAGEQIESPMLGRFGYRTGREIDKMEGLAYRLDENGEAMLDMKGVLAHISCKVVKSVDMDTHTIFICEVTDAQNAQSGTPMTYQYYRDVKKLQSSKYAPTYVKNQ